MLDNLKDHIDKQRAEFEIYPFDAKEGWDKISTKITKEEKWPRWKMISVAACVVLVMLGSISQVSFVEAEGELSEVEQFYESEINHKISLVKSQLNDPTVLDDLVLMDRAFAELKVDLDDNVDNEEVVAAMMENYQLKLRILEEILAELEKENGEKSL